VAAPIDFYFDFISPFGYFGSLRVEALAAKYHRTVDWHAMLLGVSVLKAMGLKPILETPLKGPYSVREGERYARLHGLKMKRRIDSPQMDPRACGQAFYWCKAHRPGSEPRLAAALLHAYWAEGLDLAAADAVADVAAGAGFDRAEFCDEMRAAIGTDESRALLRKAVERSLERGVFGSPTLVIDGEPFWGVQSFELAERWLATGGW
jgi:2-hydroxychromene-2-carboxylate isomerase